MLSAYPRTSSNRMMRVFTAINGTGDRTVSITSGGVATRGLRGGPGPHTPHQCSHAGNQVDDLCFDACVGTLAEGGVIGGGGEVDWEREGQILGQLGREVEDRTAREEAVFAQNGNGVDEEDGSWGEKVSQGVLCWRVRGWACRRGSCRRRTCLRRGRCGARD